MPATASKALVSIPGAARPGAQSGGSAQRQDSGPGGSARRQDIMNLSLGSADDDTKSMASGAGSLVQSEYRIDVSGAEGKLECYGCGMTPTKDSPFTPEAQGRRKGQYCGLWPWKNM